MEQSIAELFLGVPRALLRSITAIVRCRLDPALAPPTREAATLRRRRLAFGDTWPVLVLIVGVFGGLFSGVFAPTEAGAVGAARRWPC